MTWKAQCECKLGVLHPRWVTDFEGEKRTLTMVGQPTCLDCEKPYVFVEGGETEKR